MLTRDNECPYCGFEHPDADLILVGDLWMVGVCRRCGGTPERPPHKVTRIHTDIDPQALGGVNLPSAYSQGKPELYSMADGPKSRRRVIRSGTAPSRSAVVSFEEIQERQIEWLWKGRLPKGKFVVIDGDPSMGKSCFTCDVAARMSKGGLLPDGQTTIPRKVLIVSSEDDAEDTIKPRLRAAGANMPNVFGMNLRHDKKGRVIPFTVPADVPYLQQALGESGAEVVVIDPIMGFLSEHVQSHNDASVRRALAALAQVAESYGCCVVGIRHLNKDQREKNPLYRGGGSIGISGQARIVLLIGKPPWTGDDDPARVVAVTKNNLIRRLSVPSLKFEVEEWDDDPDIPHVLWHGEVPISAEQLLQTPDGRKNAPAREEAEAAINEILAAGPLSVTEFDEQLKLAGIKPDTARNARRALDVHSYAVRDEHGKVEAWNVHLAEHPCPPGCRWVFAGGEGAR